MLHAAYNVCITPWRSPWNVFRVQPPTSNSLQQYHSCSCVGLYMHRNCWALHAPQLLGFTCTAIVRLYIHLPVRSTTSTIINTSYEKLPFGRVFDTCDRHRFRQFFPVKAVLPLKASRLKALWSFTALGMPSTPSWVKTTNTWYCQGTWLWHQITKQYNMKWTIQVTALRMQIVSGCASSAHIRAVALLASPGCLLRDEASASSFQTNSNIHCIEGIPPNTWYIYRGTGAPQH